MIKTSQRGVILFSVLFQLIAVFTLENVIVILLTLVLHNMIYYIIYSTLSKCDNWDKQQVIMIMVTVHTVMLLMLLLTPTYIYIIGFICLEVGMNEVIADINYMSNVADKEDTTETDNIFSDGDLDGYEQV